MAGCPEQNTTEEAATLQKKEKRNIPGPLKLSKTGKQKTYMSVCNIAMFFGQMKQKNRQNDYA